MGRIPTDEMPFSMVYGTESVISAKIGMPNFRISNCDKKNNKVELRLNFDLLDKKRKRAEIRQVAYKHQVVKY